MMILDAKKTFLIFLLFVCAPLARADANIITRCDGCSSAQNEETARAYAVGNMTNAEKQMPRGTHLNKTVNIVDLQRDAIFSYNVLLVRLPTPDIRWQPTPSLVVTAPVVKSKFDNVIMAKGGLSISIDSLVIPASVVGNAWEFLGCAYCENTVQDYIRTQTAADIEAFYLSMERLGMAVGLVNVSLPNTFEIALASGGYIVVETSVGVGQPPPLIIKITKVVDVDSNTVPKEKNGLANLNVFVSSTASGDLIRLYISNLGFGFPSGRVGIVTITECTHPGKDKPCE